MRELYCRAQETGKEEYLLRLVDRNLHQNYCKDEVVRLLKIALICSNDIANARPSISQVVSIILRMHDVPEYLLKSLCQGLRSSPSIALSNKEIMWDVDTDDFSNISPLHGDRTNLSHSDTTGRASRSEPGTISPDMEGR